MSASDVDMCSRALVLIGEAPISSLEDDDDVSKTCALIYPMVKDEVLTMYPWRITMEKRQLARTTNTPTNDWLYEYQLPSDRDGGPQAVYNSSSTDVDPILTFEIFGDKLYANDTEIYVDFKLQTIKESQLPIYVSTLITYALASRLAESQTDDTSKSELWQNVAFGPPQLGGYGGYFITASAIDASTRPTPANVDFSLINVRETG